GATARVHAAVGQPVGQLPADGVADRDRGLSLRRRHDAHDALDRARGPARGLHPDRVGQGARAAGDRDPPRAQELDAAGHHAGRDRVRVFDRRSRRHRDRLHAERRRPLRGGRGRAPRLPGRAGARLPDRVRLRDRESAGGPDVCVVRSTHPVPLSVAIQVELTHATASAELSPKLSVAEVVVKFILTKPLGAAGAFIILAMMFLALFANALAPYDPYHGDYGQQFARPSVEHWFGTDDFGCDLLSRIMFGARIALFVGFTASFTGCT